MHKLILVGILTALLASCKTPSVHRTLYFDSLISAQVRLLDAEKAGLLKTVNVGSRSDRSTRVAGSAGWANELDAFRQLDEFDKPAYRATYAVSDGERDKMSNLTVRRYEAKDPKAPVQSLRLCYLGNIRNIRKIEGTYAEQNSLFSGLRTLTMEFEEISDASVLDGFSIDGIQKVALSDTIRFSIHGRVRR